MAEIYRVGDSIVIHDGVSHVCILRQDLDDFDNAFYYMKMKIQRDHSKMMAHVISGGVTLMDKELEVRLAEIETNSKNQTT